MTDIVLVNTGHTCMGMKIVSYAPTAAWKNQWSIYSHRANAPVAIWEVVSEIWMKKFGTELRPTFHEMIACAIIEVYRQDRLDRGATRLRRILIEA